MNPEDEVSPATINNLAYDIPENKADPEDVRRVLNYFCLLVGEGKELPVGLREFLKDGFRAYLDGNASSVDQAIGLIRMKVGRPPEDEVDQSKLAARVLEVRMAGTNHQKALEDVAERHGCKKTKVGDAWGKFKGQAVPMLLFLHSVEGDGDFTDAEWKEIHKIFKKDHEIIERWFSEQPPTITPEN